MSESEISGIGSIDIKLTKMREPEYSNHPDERMNWSINDVRRMWPWATEAPSDIPPPLVPSKY